MARRRNPVEPTTPRGRSRPGSRDLAKARAPLRAPVRSAFPQALAAVSRFIEDLHAPAALIGGVAVIAHGVARSTLDIDIAVAAGPADVPALLRAVRRAGFRPRIEAAAAFAQENLVLLLEHTASRVPVDLSLALQSFERLALENALVRRLGRTSIRVVPLSDLLIYKMVAGRPKDLEDVHGLLSTGARFDEVAVETVLAEFDALLETDRCTEFRRLRRRAGRCAGR